jgi:hypothetical protein
LAVRQRDCCSAPLLSGNPARHPAGHPGGVIGRSVVVLGLASFGGFALLALTVPLLGLGDLSRLSSIFAVRLPGRGRYLSSRIAQLIFHVCTRWKRTYDGQGGGPGMTHLRHGLD